DCESIFCCCVERRGSGLAAVEWVRCREVQGAGLTEIVSPFAGKPAQPSMLVNVSRLVTAYYAFTPDVENTSQHIAFGTSGHRGSAFTSSFNEAHILAVTQAVCRYRRSIGVDGPLFLGMDTH